MDASMKTVTDVLFDSAEPPSPAVVAWAAASSWIRSLIYHSFTGQPRRSLMRRILPETIVKSREE